MLGLSRRMGARILIASSSEVYGDPLEHPQKETYFGNVNTMGPRSCYDESKRVAESLGIIFREYYILYINNINYFLSIQLMHIRNRRISI